MSTLLFSNELSLSTQDLLPSSCSIFNTAATSVKEYDVVKPSSSDLSVELHEYYTRPQTHVTLSSPSVSSERSLFTQEVSPSSSSLSSIAATSVKEDEVVKPSKPSTPAIVQEQSSLEITRNWIRDSVPVPSPVATEALDSVDAALDEKEQAEKVEIAALEACPTDIALPGPEDVEAPGESMYMTSLQITEDIVDHTGVESEILINVRDPTSDFYQSSRATKISPSGCAIQSLATEPETLSNTSGHVDEPIHEYDDVFIPSALIPAISSADAHAALAQYPSWQVAFFKVPHTPIMPHLSAPYFHESSHGNIALHDIVCNLYPSASLAWHNHVLRVGTDRLVRELQKCFERKKIQDTTISAMLSKLCAVDNRQHALIKVNQGLAIANQVEESKNKKRVIDLEEFKAKHKEGDAPRLLQIDVLTNALTGRNKTIAELKTRLFERIGEEQDMEKRNVELEAKIEELEAKHEKIATAYTLNVAALSKTVFEQKQIIQCENDNKIERVAVTEMYKTTICRLKQEINELKAFIASANTKLVDQKLKFDKWDKNQCPKPKKENKKTVDIRTQTQAEIIETTICQQKREIDEMKASKASANIKLVDAKIKADKWDKHQCPKPNKEKTDKQKPAKVPTEIPLVPAPELKPLVEIDAAPINEDNENKKACSDDEVMEDFSKIKLREFLQILRSNAPGILCIIIWFLLCSIDFSRDKNIGMTGR